MCVSRTGIHTEASDLPLLVVDELKLLGQTGEFEEEAPDKKAPLFGCQFDGIDRSFLQQTHANSGFLIRRSRVRVAPGVFP